ncbi:hypothetical protein ABIA23_006860 [Sinorhizobium fredii]
MKNDDNGFQVPMPTYYHAPQRPRGMSGLETLAGIAFGLLLLAYLLS